MVPCILGLILFPFLVASTRVQHLLVASYQAPESALGSIQTLGLYTDARNHKKPNSLRSLHSSDRCGRKPTWLDTSLRNKTVACLDEDEPGAINMFSIRPDGSLDRISSTQVLGGPVSIAKYHVNSAVALAHYEPPAITTYSIGDGGSFLPLQNFTYEDPGDNSSTLSVPHIHQAVLDPTGQYLLLPDLGADLVRIFCIDNSNGFIREEAPLQSKLGYGPRHATFWSHKKHNRTFLFVIHELSNKIVSYQVQYSAQGGLKFTEIDEQGTFGDRDIPEGAASAEMMVSPDKRFLVVSNRNDSSFQLANPDSRNSTTLPSDSIATFKISSDGKLRFTQLAPSGGVFPRHFNMNGDGSLIAVANQLTRNVAIYHRNIRTGRIGEIVVATSELLKGLPTYVQWISE